MDDGPGVLPTEPSAAAELEDSGLPEREAADQDRRGVHLMMAKKKNGFAVFSNSIALPVLGECETIAF